MAGICPVRSYMDDPDIKWRTGDAPNYDLINSKYLRERTTTHKADSLEKLVENTVKTFEMESTHKLDYKQWRTVDPDKFRQHVNGGPGVDVKELADQGSYKYFLQKCPFYDGTAETHDSAFDKFRGCFPGGFVWELLEILSGPPKIAFTWRHWAHFEGPYEDTEPTGEMIEIFGSAVSTVDEGNKLTKVELFFDPNPMMLMLNGGKIPKH